MRPVLGLIFASCAIRIVRETRPHRDDGDGKRGTRFYKYDDDVSPARVMQNMDKSLVSQSQRLIHEI